VTEILKLYFRHSLVNNVVLGVMDAHSKETAYKFQVQYFANFHFCTNQAIGYLYIE